LHSFMTDIDTKERIKCVAHDLLMQYGIRSISMDDIASKLGMSKKTIYLYYKDKDELVEAVVDAKLAKNQFLCNADRQNADNAIHEIFLAMDMVADMFRSMNPSVIFDMQKYHPAAFSRFLKHKNDFLYNMMMQNLQRGISEELYRSEIKLNIMARFRIESMFIPFNQEFLQACRCTLLEAEQQVIMHFLFGLVTQKGYKLVLRYQEQREKQLAIKK
jgi:TetR/AcrR family transcriptional regulator, cholesterol catabolism regulator